MNADESIDAGRMALVGGPVPITGRSEFVCLRNCLLPDGASPSAIRRLALAVDVCPFVNGRGLQISLMRTELGGYAHQDLSQPLGLSAPLGVGIRHAHQGRSKRWRELRGRLRDLAG
jgi:hypothetical protein